MLQATLSRLDGIGQDAGTIISPIVVANEDYRFITAEQIRQVGKRARSIVLEPVGRNTAPALTLAALAASTDSNDPVMLVTPADHVIADITAFQEAVIYGARFSAQGSLVTFGIKPSLAETGYGYIRTGATVGHLDSGTAYSLAEFVEKPDIATAQRYVDSGHYLWNSGMFMMKASRWLEEISRFRPDISTACRQAYAAGTCDNDFFRVDRPLFSACPPDSIDYAVMEKVTKTQSSGSAIVIELNAGWSDVGAWDAIWRVGAKDKHGNLVKGDVLTIDTKDTLVIAQNRFVACVGLKDVVVVETPDAVMVAHKDRTQDVTQIVRKLKQDHRPECTAHRKIHRPWGYYDSIDDGERFQVKRIVVSPGASLSLQMHHHRAEHWIVVRGTALVTRDDEVLLLSENQSAYIPLGVKHRLQNPGKLPLEIIEVQSGPYLGEDDIVRFEDTYGRREFGQLT